MMQTFRTDGILRRAPLADLVTLRLLVFVCLLACGLVGCSDNGLKMVPVTGKVTLDGGDWGRPGLIYFTPAEPAPGFPRRGGMADFDVQGNFVAETFKPRDGLIPGRYVVNLECWKVPPTMGGPQAVSYLPEEYKQGSSSGFEVNVSPDQRGTLQVEFDVLTSGE